MTSHHFIHDEVIKRKIKWKKIYGKTRNRVVYEGFTLNNKPCGQGTTYYSNGKKHLEGKFYIKGFVEGKEYYRNGQIRFEGKCIEHYAYGPNYPEEGKWYDMDGKLLYSGKFKAIAKGSLGFTMIECPEGFGGILREDTDLEFLRCPDVEKAKEEPKVIAAYDESKYPMTYEQFKEHLLKVFVEEKWSYRRQFTEEEKYDFIDNHEFDFNDFYNKECEKYDKNMINLFLNPEKENYPVNNLLFECDMYHISKNLLGKTSLNDINEDKYPMTYDLFKEKMIGFLISEANPKISTEEVIKDLEEFFENDPTYLLYIYRKKCEEYDKLISEKHTVQASYVFGDGYLSGEAFNWGTWLDYWFFL